MGSLRLLLALCVAFGHFGIPLGFPTSDIAVQSFFVISGFYMALVLNEKYGPGSYWLFISNRLLRLWPTYLVILIPSFLIASNWRAVLSLDPASIIYYFVSQIFVLGQETYFYLFTEHGTLGLTLHPGTMPNLLYKLAPVPQAWTLALEFYFYLMAPFIVRRGPAFIGAIVAARVLLRMALLFIFDLGPSLRCSSPVRSATTPMRRVATRNADKHMSCLPARPSCCRFASPRADGTAFRGWHRWRFLPP